MRVAIIALRWLPRFGGGEQYVHRLACALSEAGVETLAATGSPASPEGGNGDFPVTRIDAGITSLRPADQLDWTTRGDENFLRFRTWVEAVLDWAAEKRLTHVLINQPLTHGSFFYALELYQRLQAKGLLVGAIHHDLGLPTRDAVFRAYREKGSWEDARDRVCARIQQILREEGSIKTAWKYDLALYFRPDFLISVSDWNAPLADPGGTIPSFVLHPRLPLVDAPTAVDATLMRRTLLMVNPTVSKGSHSMLRIIANRPPEWSVRILAGGHGTKDPEFMQVLNRLPTAQKRGIEFLPQVPEVRAAYAAADAVVDPSLYEGYGLVAVEAMQVGTPVVTSGYPSIREAVGGAARCVCPFTAKKGDWLAAIREVLDDRDTWVARARDRVKELDDRAERELQQFVDFLGRLTLHGKRRDAP